MDDFSGYFNDNSTKDPYAKPALEDNGEEISTIHPMSDDDIKMYCDRLSGKDKVYLSYDSYEYTAKDNDNSDGNVDGHDFNNAYIKMTYDVLNPGIIACDIIFDSADDPQIKLLYASLEAWRDKMNKGGYYLPDTDKTIPIFDIHIEEKDSADDGSLLECDIANPLLYTITRSTPNQMVKDMADRNNILIGGNIIRLLLNTDLVTFTI